MASDLFGALSVSAGGMSAQSLRIKTITENIANSDSVIGEGMEPYRRKQVVFQSIVEKNSGLNHVNVKEVAVDRETPLRKAYEPAHPQADANGFVSYPNVDSLVESVDLREATRMYEANMQAFTSTKEMMSRSLDLLQ